METMLERRASPRKPIGFPIKYFYFPPDADPPRTCTIDLSPQGACIEALDPFPQGASVAFYIVTPENQVVDVRAQVVYTQPVKSPPSRVGVRFTYLSPADRTALQNAIERAAA